jgi:hypothetical protein
MVLFIMLSGITYGRITADAPSRPRCPRDFTDPGCWPTCRPGRACQLNEQAALNPAYVAPAGLTPDWHQHHRNLAVVRRTAADATAPGDRSPTLWPTPPAVARRTVIRASGTFRGDTRNVTAVAGSTDVGGFKVLADKSISYEQGPAAAWSNAVQGRSVKVQNGTGLGAGTTFLTGNVAVTGAGPLDLTTYPGMASKVSPATKLALYGAQAAKLTTPGAMKIPAGITPDTLFVTDNLSRCGAAVPEDWVASRAGGILVANNNTACYNSMTFDVPVTVTGTARSTPSSRTPSTSKAASPPPPPPRR